ncbi:MAG: heat-inducible transcriptional repressor HrcA [Chloroflexota bacterium]
MNRDAASSTNLTERQENILALVVREYTNNLEPISSKHLADLYLTSISSATIRNELAVLEELGYVIAPHHSAGRIPTEAGYRYFVKRLLDDGELGELPIEEQKNITERFSQAPVDVEQWMQLAVSTLARTSNGAALVTAPRAFSSQFKHIELISTQGRLVLMVLVLYGGEVRQQLLTLAEALSQEALSAAALHLNTICDGLTGEQVKARSRAADNELEREMLEIITDALEESDHKQYVVTYREGLSDVLPQFTESQGAQQVLRLMEERHLLAGILSEALDQSVGRVTVVIAGEGRWSEITHLSMVLSRYGVNGQATGTLGVLGPTRMRYGHTISAVRYVAGLMSGLLVNVYGAKGDGDPSLENSNNS